MANFTPEQLLSVLAMTKKPVKVFEFGSTDHIHVSPAAALLMAKTGDYVGGGNPRRCRYLRPTSAPPKPDPRDAINFRPMEGFIGQTFLRYPQRGGELYPW